MDQSDPVQSLICGASILGRLLTPLGFNFQLDRSGSGSGGRFASGTFSRENRSIELWFRFGLGGVSYRLGDKAIGHADFMRYSGNWSKKKYPEFSADPMESFSALSTDLENCLADFLTGDGREFIAVVDSYTADPDRYTGIAATDQT